MYKCPDETAAARDEDRRGEPVARPFIAQRLRFDALAFRDRARWAAAEDAETLRALARDVARELVPGELPRFSAWVAEHHGLRLARAAGLAPSPLRLVGSA
jgi:hypothetical protein